MSKLEELIAELCPDGVEYVKLKEIAQISAGGDLPENFVKGKKVPTEQYPYPIYSNGTEDGALYGYTDSYKIEKEAVTISARGTIGYHEVRAGKFTPIVRLITMIADESKITTKFLHYALYVAGIGGVKTGIPSLTVPMLEKFSIPVPPLPVQEEFVRIFDNFTNLTAELTAELTARKKQYEYYRDELLTFGEDVPIVKLGDIATDIYRGSGIKRDEVLEEGIPCVRYGEIYTSYDISFRKCKSHTSVSVVKIPKYFEHGDIIFTITGESIEEIAKSIAYLGNDKCMAGGDTVVLKHNQEPRYMSYALSTTDAQSQKSKGKVKSKVVHSSVPALKEIKIPLPDYETQAKIADLLDSFHQLINDISTGLPAEIEARQKQYEYYRDKLLAFKERA